MEGVSLKYKLLAALTVIPIVGLSLFLLLAKGVFEKDKMSYLFDSSISEARNRAATIESEIENLLGITKTATLSYDHKTKSLSEIGQEYFKHQDKIEVLEIGTLDSEGRWQAEFLQERNVGNETLKASEKLIEAMVQKTKETPQVIGMASDGGSGETLIVVQRLGKVERASSEDSTLPMPDVQLIAVALLDFTDVSALFESANGSYANFVLRKDLGQKDWAPIFKPALERLGMDKEAAWDATAILKEARDPINAGTSLASQNVHSEGTREIVSPVTGVSYIASFAEAKGFVILSLVNKAEAFKALEVLARKSILFFLAVLSATTIIAVIASRGLTSALRHLSDATRRIAGGDFAVRVLVKGGGEIGVLASSFNTMAAEVERLMKETAEKARMESELATARTVQETLFPTGSAEIGPVNVAGRYMPASECGGDWWYYCENGDKVYIWIGDATGHGAPAALLTSAARAVASVIEGGPPMRVSDALGVLNRAISDTSKGKMMMTFFLAAIDKATGEMSYANASHESPLIIHRKADGSYERDDFEPIDGVNNPRLGERRDCVFSEASIYLEPGDRIVFYTDGLVDVKNAEQKNFGERRFIKSLASEVSQAEVLDTVIDGVVTTLEQFRAGEPLPDDVTLVMCTYKGAA